MRRRLVVGVALLGCACSGSIAGNGGGDPGDDGARDDASPGGGHYFPGGTPFTRDISDAPLADGSDRTIAWLDLAGGWGGGALRVDFSIEVLRADDDAPMRSFDPTDDHFTPDCDVEPVPIPPGGAVEGEVGYACTSGGDCHLIVVQESTGRLYEMWRADIDGDRFRGGCLAIWDTTRVYGPEGRGLHCTSADAAGLPLAPLLFTADEVAAGSIDHAIRFILPNNRIRGGVFVAPATHTTDLARGPNVAPPYGTRLRLRADYPVDELPSEGARVVARALQRYGMFLADGGSIALTAQSDRFTEASWDGLLGAGDLAAIEVTDFEVVQPGPMTEYTGRCERVD